MAQHSKALIVSLISALLIMGLAAKPVQAGHNDNLLVPLAGFVLLGSLLKHNHGHGHGHGYSKRRYGHNGHNGNYAHNGHGAHQNHRRARSHSHEGYKRRQKRNNHR